MSSLVHGIAFGEEVVQDVHQRRVLIVVFAVIGSEGEHCSVLAVPRVRLHVDLRFVVDGLEKQTLLHRNELMHEAVVIMEGPVLPLPRLEV